MENEMIYFDDIHKYIKTEKISDTTIELPEYNVKITNHSGCLECRANKQDISIWFDYMKIDNGIILYLHGHMVAILSYLTDMYLDLDGSVK